MSGGCLHHGHKSSLSIRDSQSVESQISVAQSAQVKVKSTRRKPNRTSQSTVIEKMMPKRRVGSRKVHNKKLLLAVDNKIPGMDEQAAWLVNAEVNASKRGGEGVERILVNMGKAG